MTGKFEIKNGPGGFRFNLKAGNGQTILTSEQYVSKSGVENGIRSVKENSKRKSQFEERTARNGETYFVLKRTGRSSAGAKLMNRRRDGRMEWSQFKKAPAARKSTIKRDAKLIMEMFD